MTEETKPRCGWTAREALACAYCWSEFHHPEDRDDTPETYWLKIGEQARNNCRSIANKKLLLSVAVGQAVAVPPAVNLQEGQFEAVKAELGMKIDSRVRKIIDTVARALKP